MRLRPRSRNAASPIPSCFASDRVTSTSAKEEYVSRADDLSPSRPSADSVARMAFINSDNSRDENSSAIFFTSALEAGGLRLGSNALDGKLALSILGGFPSFVIHFASSFFVHTAILLMAVRFLVFLLS